MSHVEGLGTVSCAFSAPTRFPLNFNASTTGRACICMKTKRKGTAKEKGAAKSKRVSPSGAGFTPGGNDKKNNGNQNVQAIVNNEGTTEENATAVGESSEQVERVSGASGDATPHRVQVKVAASEEMQNPEEEPEELPEAPLLELPLLTPERKAELRFPREANPDRIIERFADAHAGDDFGAVVIANRDLVTERLLYRFTSLILQVESRTTELETREEEAKNMRALRKDLIAYCWSHDFPLKVELQKAEPRLLSVLQGTNAKKDVKKNCGQSTLEINAFWIVLFAAIAAWEERGRENPELANVDMQTALKETAEATGTVKEFSTLLSPALQAVQEILSSTDPKTQAKVVSDLDEDTIQELGALTEQTILFPVGAYGALAMRMTQIMDYIVSARYQISQNAVQPVRFNLTPVQSNSALVEFSRRSKNVRRVQ